MPVKPTDTYRITCSAGMSNDRLCSFMTLYQPLVGGDGILVYLTLMSEASFHRTLLEHRRLFTLMQGIDPDSFERARMRLESYMLMRTWIKEGKSGNSYLYELNSPLGPKDFFASQYMSKMYLQAVGDRQFQLTRGFLCDSDVPKEKYRDISAPVRNIHTDDFDNETDYVTITPRYQFTDHGDDHIHFDYERFLVITSNLVFPPELRTQENMALIGTYATLYGISPERMNIIVSRCISLESMQFDTNRFDILCRREKPSVKEQSDDRYQMSPISFLMDLQKGASVTKPDQEIITYLSKEMHFPNEVINVMLEYVLKKCDNRLNPVYVGRISGTWARSGIDTEQKALDAIAKAEETKPQNNPVRKQNVQKVSMPKYWDENHESSTVDEESLKAIEQLQKEMG
ncbi:MAG: DnaD domain protein [Bulleidia sp.]